MDPQQQQQQQTQQNQTPKPPVNKTSTQNTLEIAEIRDGVVIMNDGSFRAVLECQSINFDLMSPKEREAVEFSYQGFLNSLYFNIQVFVRSQKVDLRSYIDKLNKIRSEHDNMLLALLMEDYVQYISIVAQQTNIMDKRFYVVIPFESELNAAKALKASKGFFTGIFGRRDEHVTINENDLEAAKDELKNRVRSVMGGLQNCQVASVALDTEELIELYYDAYNPDTATRQKMRNFRSLDAPVITKGEGDAQQPHIEREVV